MTLPGLLCAILVVHIWACILKKLRVIEPFKGKKSLSYERKVKKNDLFSLANKG